MKRCSWAKSPILTAYHDTEWGVPLHDDRSLFEFLMLEGAQAGLSWETILKKRDNYRLAFDDFDAASIAQYDRHKVEQLLEDSGIIRNRSKIEAVVENAKACLRVQEEFGSLDAYLWSFVEGRPRNNNWSGGVLPAFSEESTAMSKDLKKRGFKFVGPTICYAFMQAVGMVNDHERECFRYEEVRRL